MCLLLAFITRVTFSFKFTAFFVVLLILDDIYVLFIVILTAELYTLYWPLCEKAWKCHNKHRDFRCCSSHSQLQLFFVERIPACLDYAFIASDPTICPRSAITFYFSKVGNPAFLIRKKWDHCQRMFHAVPIYIYIVLMMTKLKLLVHETKTIDQQAYLSQIVFIFLRIILVSDR